MDTLPYELLAYIFEIGQQDHTYSFTSPFEVLVSHVSAQWRAVALNHSALWSDIQADARHPLERVKAYIHRSKEHPLRISFDHAGEGQEEHIEGLMTFHHLIGHLDRCASLRLRTTEHILNIILPAFPPLQMPLLEHCSISIRDADCLDRKTDSEFKPSIFTGPGAAPKLRLLHLAGCRVIISCGPPLHSLVTLHLHQFSDEDEYPSMTYEHFRSMLAAAPQLENLSMHGEVVVNWPLDNCFSIQPIVAPNLRALSIKFISVPSYTFVIFKVLDAPLLTDLSLISMGDGDMDPFGFGQDTVGGRRVFESVRKMTLKTPRLTMRMLPRFCRIFPRVEEVRVRGQVTSDMRMYFSNPARWPDFRVMEISHVRTLTDGGTTLAMLLKERYEAGKRVEVLRLESEDMVSPEYLDIVRGCVDRVEVAGQEISDEAIIKRPWWEATRDTPWWMARVHDPFWGNNTG